MRRKLLAVTLALALFAALGTVVYANHYSGAAQMGLGSREFHYLGQTLLNGDPSTPVTFTGNVGENTITIYNESKTQHIVEFEQITGPTPGYEIETALIPQKRTTTLTVDLPAVSLWKVYCPLHDTGKKKMLFYLNIP